MRRNLLQCIYYYYFKYYYYFVGQHFNYNDSINVQFFSCGVEVICRELFPVASVFLDFWVIVCPFLIC